MKLGLTVMLGLSIMGLFSTGCGITPALDKALSTITKPYHFSIASYELKVIPHEIVQQIGNRDNWTNEDSLVSQYFATVKQIKALQQAIKAINDGIGQGNLASLEAELNRLQEQQASSTNPVERIIERQIKETLAEQGIFNPTYNYLPLKINLPPLNFRLEEPPHLLVVSPRDRIDSIREILLLQNLSVTEMETIEAEADELGVSSLVVNLGGLGSTYPTFVSNNTSLRFTLDAVAEEWLHQYLFFKPLGFLYGLDIAGIRRNYEIAIMNETAVGIVSKEIGGITYHKYYPGHENSAAQHQKAQSAFDFNREMRNTRTAVDAYLARGEIELAEEFMEQQRQYLAQNGYYIRKLNQAYFAFYGAYGDSPTSISPIGKEMRQLRAQSNSLEDFLNRVSVMTNRQDLIASLK